jgi:hypothetical protein
MGEGFWGQGGGLLVVDDKAAPFVRPLLGPTPPEVVYSFVVVTLLNFLISFTVM